MKKVLMILFIIILSGCTIKTETEYVVDQATKDQLYNQILEELKKELAINYQPSLSEVENMVLAIIENNEKAMIGVSNYIRDGLNTYKLAGTGSGFIYDYDGEYYYAITNEHVVEGASRIKVVLENKDEINVEKIYGNQIFVADRQSDIAVIKFKYTEPLKVVQFADSSTIKKGQFAIAVGNPLGHNFFASVTLGVVSGVARGVPVDYNDDGITDWTATLIQHDVAISPGNSGGPLFDINGHVIGVNNMKIVDSDVSNIGFAIPANITKQIAEKLRKDGKVERVSLGVVINNQQLPDGVDSGVWVTDIVKDGSVDGSGIRINDVIIGFNDIEIRNFSDLDGALSAATVGETIQLIVLRNGERLTFNIKLKARAYN